MALTLKVECSMCGGSESYSKQPLEFDLDVNDLLPRVLKWKIEKCGWIVQFNDNKIDTYCTKKCAE